MFICRQQFDKTFENINDLKPAVNVYLTVKKFLTYWDEKRDRHRFEKLCRYIFVSQMQIIHVFMVNKLYFYFYKECIYPKS